MGDSRKLIKKIKYDGFKSRGFVFYHWSEQYEYSFDKIIEVVKQIKKDFPSVENKPIGIKSFFR